MSDDAPRDGTSQSNIDRAELSELFGSIPPPPATAPYRIPHEPTIPSTPTVSPVPFRDTDSGSFGAGFVLGLFCGVIGVVYALTRARPQTRNGVFIGLCAQLVLGMLSALTHGR